MSVFFEYLLKLSISLGVVYLFYHFLLRKLTFYLANRWYLLLYSFSSFLIPLINVHPILQRNQLEVSGIMNYIPVVSRGIATTHQELSTTITYDGGISPGQWVVIILVLGIVVMLLRLLVQYISFLRVKRSSTLLVADRIRIFHVKDRIIPFSIGNSIFINQHLHKEEELKEIIRHEFIHVKQRHSIDIFLSEFLCVLNWYNPFAWLIRRAIKVNLEYIADNKVLEGGIDKKQYQYLLLKVIGVPQFSITTQFNFSSLKKRIAMMNKKETAKAHLLKLLLLLPVLLIVLLAFRSAGKNLGLRFPEKANYQDTVPLRAPNAAPPKIDFDDFLKRNPSVKNAEVKNNVLVLELKSGAKEAYNLSKPADRATAEKKYGELPILPPTAPPTPMPPPPGMPESPSLKDPAGVDKSQLELEKELLARHDELKKLKRAQEREHELLRMEHEGELLNLEQRRQDELKQMTRERQKEMELLQKKFQLESEKYDQMLKEEFEKASKEKGADIEKLKKHFETERNREMARRQLEFSRLNKERQAEMELMQKKFEFEARNHEQLLNDQLLYKQKELLNRRNELEERSIPLQNRRDVDTKKLSPDEKKAVISELEHEKQELNKLMQELKSKETEINKQIQELKKVQGKGK